MIPTGVIVVAATVVYALFDKIGHTEAVTFIYHWLSVPLQGLGGSFGGIIIISLLVPILLVLWGSWWNYHGSNYLCLSDSKYLCQCIPLSISQIEFS